MSSMRIVGTDPRLRTDATPAATVIATLGVLQNYYKEVTT
jgi:hypothetical protein